MENNPLDGLTEGYKSRLLSIGLVMLVHFFYEWSDYFFAGLGVELHVESYALSLDGGNEFHDVTPSQGLVAGLQFFWHVHLVAEFGCHVAPHGGDQGRVTVLHGKPTNGGALCLPQ